MTDHKWDVCDSSGYYSVDTNEQPKGALGFLFEIKMLFLLLYYLLASKDKFSSPHFILRIFSALLLEKKLTVSDLNCLEDGTLSYAVF